MVFGELGEMGRGATSVLLRVKYKKTRGRIDDDQVRQRRNSISVRELIGGEEEL